MTTVRGIGFLPAGGRTSPQGAAGFGGGAGGTGGAGAYELGGRLTVSCGAAVAAAQTAANWRAAAARSSRLRQRGHHEGSPARRAPQFGHASIMSVSAARSAKLSLKSDGDAADPEVVNLLLIPALLLLLGFLLYKKVWEPKRGARSESKAEKKAVKSRATASGRMGSVL